MKKTFKWITILVSISLVGIIYIQISWLRNMVLLQEEQIKEKIGKAGFRVQESLGQYKTGFIRPARPYNSSNRNSLFPDDFSYETLMPMSIGKRFTASELAEKIHEEFKAVGLDKMKFEFLLTSGSSSSMYVRESRKSQNYNEAQKDTVNNLSGWYTLRAPSGSYAENLVEEENIDIVALNWKDFAFLSLWPRIVTAILFTIIIITAFFLTVRTMFRQKKLGDIKNDFINNMTHEFKTPIATISLAVDALKNEKVQANPEKLEYFRNIIKEENVRMNKHVESILKASQIERQELEFNMVPTSVHDIITSIAGNFTLQLADKNGKITLDLNATHDIVSADEVQFSNMINNLIDNAVKYSKDNVPLHVSVTTRNVNKQKLQVIVEDNGIGMSRETLKRVFEKFYRAHTGNVHNVKGFGLGLSYVKSVVEAHAGEIKADSTLGKGSSFILELPTARLSED